MLAVLCASAQAHVVHKCVAPGATVSYQDTPCPEGEREHGSWDAMPEPPPSAEELRAQEERRRSGREESEFFSRRAGTSGTGVARFAPQRAPRTSGASSCDAAKAKRQRRLDAVGLKRTYELLQKLDEEVRAACG
ncbi:DUF4124 domain-containing protein [Lysobacter panacisoli]|uniref:DUF4124 domain-containing protein n=1 Tax=Lysobacter panacisoli TaxID=1255263 RepID=A0ABP9LDL1_9GAMM|nr:DUF4124 domain-containing protein [Lysobacter panacisoli]